MTASRTAFERNYEDQHDPWLGVDLDPLGVDTPAPKCPVRVFVGGKAKTCRRPVPCPVHDVVVDLPDSDNPDYRIDR